MDYIRPPQPGPCIRLKRAREKDIQIALKWMSLKHVHGADASATSSAESSVESATSDEGEESDEGSGRQRLRTDALPVWSEREVEEYVGEGEGERCVVVVNGRLVNVSGYLVEHVRTFFLLAYLFVQEC